MYNVFFYVKKTLYSKNILEKKTLNKINHNFYLANKCKLLYSYK